MRYLSGASVDEARQALSEDLPDMPIESLRRCEQGWDTYAFILNEAWIVRFPKDSDFRGREERWVLAKLDGRCSIPIPQIELVGATTSFVGYRMLPGVRMQDAWTLCSPLEREREIDRLTSFCAEMHLSLDVEEAKKEGLLQEGTDFDSVLEATEIDPAWQAMARQAVVRVNRGQTTVCVVHNDLHGENILIDPVTHRITAVIDFADVAYGDPCIDLNYLCEFGLDNADRIARRYEASGGGRVDPQRILDLYFLKTLAVYLDPGMLEAELPLFRKLLEDYVAHFGASSSSP